jgi:ADP-ribose pyrophosphatase YjhB (NUDIX family)
MKFDDSKNKITLQELIDTKNFVSQLSVDCVIFGFHNNTLKVLLLKYHELNLWAIPGGFVFEDEDLDDAATRILYERTHLKEVYLEQFYAFGDKNRTEKNPHRQLLENKGIDVDKNHWIYKRFVTIGYYALIDYTLSHTFPDSFNETCEWFDVKNLPDMAFDHKEIIEKGLHHLRQNLDYKIVGSNLLPEKFTMKDLQNLYETILDEKFRRNNFQRKMLSLDVLERHEKLFDGSANKAPFLYSFIKK